MKETLEEYGSLTLGVIVAVIVSILTINLLHGPVSDFITATMARVL